MTTREFLKAICEATGVSGYEQGVRAIVSREFSSLCDETHVDPMGNLWGVKRGSLGQRRIMLAAHMDEIGLIVKKLDKHVIRFTQVGGFDVRVLPGQPVTVHGTVDLPGVIGSRAPHVLPASERDKVVPMDNLFIDVGLSEDEIGSYVHTGDLITIRRGFVDLKNNLAASKAMDDRAGVASLYECLRLLQTLKHEWDVYAVATVQEEVGLRGAMTSAYGVAPDAAIAIDVTFARTPELPEVGTFELDKGPAIARGPNMHPALTARLEETARLNEIPYQSEPLPGRTGTDAWAIQVAREGVPTGLIGLPLRYMHTPCETLSIRDVERAGRLMAWFITGLSESFVGELVPSLPEAD